MVMGIHVFEKTKEIGYLLRNCWYTNIIFEIFNFAQRGYT